MITQLDELLPIKSHHPDHVVLQDHVANKNHHISITIVSMATKLGRMIASLDGLCMTLRSHGLVRCEVHLQEEVQHTNV